MFGANFDIEEILDGIDSIINQHEITHFDKLVLIDEFVHQKRLEFVEPQGDCCG